MMLKYYGRRAREYDRIYEIPERQADLAHLVSEVRAAIAGRAVLEIACGTGWWTEKMAGAASSIVATDGAPEVLEVARAREAAGARGAGETPTEYRVADAFAPDRVDGTFDALVAGFWMSHVPRRDAAAFLARWNARLGCGRVVLFDNRYVPGKNTPLSRTDDAGDTFQIRRLDDGSEYEVLKNFPSPTEVRAWIEGSAGVVASSVRVHELGFYWLATYDLEI